MDSNIGLTAATMLEEMMEITGQNLVRMEVEDHYKFIKQLGKGKYGQVTLVMHRQRDWISDLTGRFKAELRDLIDFNPSRGLHNALVK